MPKGTTIWVDRETYKRLKDIAIRLNMRSISELLKLLVGTHPTYKLFIEEQEEFYRKFIDCLKKSIRDGNPSYKEQYEGNRQSIENIYKSYSSSIEGEHNEENIFNERYIEDIIAIADGKISDKKSLSSVIKGIVEACEELGVFAIPAKAFEKILKNLYKGRVPSVYDLNHPDIRVNAAKDIVIIKRK